jgi:hypothetical protein
LKLLDERMSEEYKTIIKQNIHFKQYKMEEKSNYVRNGY